MSDKSVGELAHENLATFLGDGPRLTTKYNTWVEGRSTVSGESWILVGGLGGLGVGQMWKCEDEDSKNRPGYDEAPYYDHPDNSPVRMLR